ncbi:MAG: tRNA 2-thiouridine(34) synthase MnmA [Actinomycetota bacterium]
MTSKGSVLVAMSGGVDSSVAACLLLEQGYEVMGSQMKLLHLADDPADHGCCGPTAQADARAVAEHVGLPFEIVDMSETFEETVLDDYFSEHRDGRTPNPCVRCNEHIKFRAFVDRADELGADFVATGHYVRTRRDGLGRWHLRRGSDLAKDQSYVLHMLGQSQLARSLFPVGGMEKAETRALAERFGLGVAGKPDSQEVCFVPGTDHAAFIEEYVPAMVQPGDIVDPDGNVVGEHRGAWRYTVGQRRGLGVSAPEPRYVVEVDAPGNRVVIGPEELLARRGLIADRVSWIAGAAPADGPFEGEVKIRYNGDDVPAVVEPRGEGSARVEFRVPVRAVAPGQSVVVYRGDEVLGGGRIVETF